MYLIIRIDGKRYLTALLDEVYFDDAGEVHFSAVDLSNEFRFCEEQTLGSLLPSDLDLKEGMRFEVELGHIATWVYLGGSDPVIWNEDEDVTVSLRVTPLSVLLSTHVFLDEWRPRHAEPAFSERNHTVNSSGMTT